MQIRTDFPRPVRVVEHLWIPLPDGSRLAARVWLPEDAERDPVPAILDAVPYRKGDGTAAGDMPSNRYLAGHGYAGVRIDLRGSGDSDGLIGDEYSEQEAEDVDAVIAWLAEQPWCTGAVGMTGVSWGGFAALQAASRNPPALQGDRADPRVRRPLRRRRPLLRRLRAGDRHAPLVDLHGGLRRPAARPGRRRRGVARARGRERIASMEPWVATWLAHQRRDDYWRQGSACERYADITCPVFAIGGWSDGYRDMVLRMLEHVRAPVRGLIGPWGHTGPESRRARPRDRLPPGAACGSSTPR